jgi:hypothetical protein
LDKTGFLSLTAKGRDLFDVVRHAFGEDRYSFEKDKLIIDL